MVAQHVDVLRSFPAQPCSAARRGGIPTQEGTGSFRNDIPLPQLLGAFADHAYALVRNDRTEGDLPARFVADAEGRWIDYKLPC